MTIRFRDINIDTKMFERPTYVRDFDLIAFTTTEGMLEQQLTLNLCFDSPEAARKAFFCIHRNLANGTRTLDMSDTVCTWPKTLARTLESYVSLD